MASGDYGALGAFDACLVSVSLSSVPWPAQPRVLEGLRRVLAPSGILVLAETDHAEAQEPTRLPHCERRPFGDYAARARAAGFGLVEHRSYEIAGTRFFAAVWQVRGKM